jgi:hypothetical protein
MKTVLFDLFTSKKFLATLTAIIVYTGGRLGLAIDPAVLDRIWQALLVYVGSQGLADIGKSATLLNISKGTVPSTPAVPGTGARIGPAGALVLIGLVGLAVASTIPACSASQRKDVVNTTGKAVIECVGVDVGLIATDMEKVCQPEGGDLDLACVEQKALAGGGVVGGCAFVRIAEHYLASLLLASGPPVVSSGVFTSIPGARGAQVRKALEDFRAAHAGGAFFHVEGGLR